MFGVWSIILVFTPLAIASLSFFFLPAKLAIISCLLGWCMFGIAAYDFRYYIIPDILSLPLIPLGLLSTCFTQSAIYASDLVLYHCISAMAAGLLLLVVRVTYRLLRGREGLGLGDVKLGMTCGAWIGFIGFTHAIALASSIAIAHILFMNINDLRKLNLTTRVPFGAYFAPAIWVVWIVSHLPKNFWHLDFGMLS